MKMYYLILAISLTLWRDKSGCPGDWVPLDMITSLKLDTIRRGNDGDGDTVSPTVLVSPRPRHQEQVLVLRLEPRLRMELREGEVSQAA